MAACLPVPGWRVGANIVFIEWKYQARDRKGHAVEERLRATIGTFGQAHDSSRFQPYGCMRLQLSVLPFPGEREGG